MSARCLLIPLMFCLAVAIAPAQTPTPSQGPPPIERGVFLTINGLSLSADTTFVAQPLMMRLSSEKHLASLRVGNVLGVSSDFEMRFLFASIAEFHQWYNDPTTQELLSMIRQWTKRADFRSTLSFNR